MTRRETVLRKLHSLPDEEVNIAIEQLALHVQARLRFKSKWDRTKSGAHGPKNLGLQGVDFYVGESVKRLYDPNGWDWKFERFTLAEQLIRIANKLISDKVEAYRKGRETMPSFQDEDISEIKDLEIEDEIDSGNQELCDKLIQVAYELTKGDDNLNYFTMRYFEGAAYEVIASEMNLTLDGVYVLKKKLVRKLIASKALDV
jgi:hypothetical protein